MGLFDGIGGAISPQGWFGEQTYNVASGKSSPGDVLSGFGDTVSDVITLGGASRQARAAQAAAEAQLAEQRRLREQAMQLATPSESELDSQSQVLSLARRQNTFAMSRLADIEKQLSQVNPLIGLYAKQQQDILEGKTPSVLQPIQQQMENERMRNENRMRASMGTGYGQSSAGIQQQAIQNQAMAQARVGALSGLGGLMGSTIQGAGSLGQQGQQGLAGSAALFSSYNEMINAQKTRQLQALLGTSLTQYSGAGSVGELMRGAFSQKYGEQLTGGAVGALTGVPMSFGGGGSSQLKTGSTGYGTGYGQPSGPKWEVA